MGRRTARKLTALLLAVCLTLCGTGFTFGAGVRDSGAPQGLKASGGPLCYASGGAARVPLVLDSGRGRMRGAKTAAPLAVAGTKSGWPAPVTAPLGGVALLTYADKYYLAQNAYAQPANQLAVRVEGLPAENGEYYEAELRLSDGGEVVSAGFSPSENTVITFFAIEELWGGALFLGEKGLTLTVFAWDESGARVALGSAELAARFVENPSEVLAPFAVATAATEAGLSVAVTGAPPLPTEKWCALRVKSEEGELCYASGEGLGGIYAEALGQIAEGGAMKDPRYRAVFDDKDELFTDFCVLSGNLFKVAPAQAGSYRLLCESDGDEWELADAVIVTDGAVITEIRPAEDMPQPAAGDRLFYAAVSGVFAPEELDIRVKNEQGELGTASFVRWNRMTGTDAAALYRVELEQPLNGLECWYEITAGAAPVYYSPQDSAFLPARGYQLYRWNFNYPERYASFTLYGRGGAKTGRLELSLLAGGQTLATKTIETAADEPVTAEFADERGLVELYWGSAYQVQWVYTPQGGAAQRPARFAVHLGAEGFARPAGQAHPTAPLPKPPKGGAVCADSESILTLEQGDREWLASAVLYAPAAEPELAQRLGLVLADAFGNTRKTYGAGEFALELGVPIEGWRKVTARAEFPKECVSGFYRAAITCDGVPLWGFSPEAVGNSDLFTETTLPCAENREQGGEDGTIRLLGAGVQNSAALPERAELAFYEQSGVEAAFRAESVPRLKDGYQMDEPQLAALAEAFPKVNESCRVVVGSAGRTLGVLEKAYPQKRTGAEGTRVYARLDLAERELQAGTSVRLQGTALPDKGQLLWKSSNPAVAEITPENGGKAAVVRGLRAGRAVVTFTNWVGGKAAAATCTVTVREQGVPAELAVSATPATTLPTNGSVAVTVLCEGGREPYTLAISCEQCPPVAAQGGGFVAPVNGVYNIIAEDADGKRGACTIVVDNIDKVAPAAPLVRVDSEALHDAPEVGAWQELWVEVLPAEGVASYRYAAGESEEQTAAAEPDGTAVLCLPLKSLGETLVVRAVDAAGNESAPTAAELVMAVRPLGLRLARAGTDEAEWVLRLPQGGAAEYQIYQNRGGQSRPMDAREAEIIMEESGAMRVAADAKTGLLVVTAADAPVRESFALRCGGETRRFQMETTPPEGVNLRRLRQEIGEDGAEVYLPAEGEPPLCQVVLPVGEKRFYHLYENENRVKQLTEIFSGEALLDARLLGDGVLELTALARFEQPAEVTATDSGGTARRFCVESAPPSRGFYTALAGETDWGAMIDGCVPLAAGGESKVIYYRSSYGFGEDELSGLSAEIFDSAGNCLSGGGLTAECAEVDDPAATAPTEAFFAKAIALTLCYQSPIDDLVRNGCRLRLTWRGGEAFCELALLPDNALRLVEHGDEGWRFLDNRTDGVYTELNAHRGERREFALANADGKAKLEETFTTAPDAVLTEIEGDALFLTSDRVCYDQVLSVKSGGKTWEYVMSASYGGYERDALATEDGPAALWVGTMEENGQFAAVSDCFYAISDKNIKLNAQLAAVVEGRPHPAGAGLGRPKLTLVLNEGDADLLTLGEPERLNGRWGFTAVLRANRSGSATVLAELPAGGETYRTYVTVTVGEPRPEGFAALAGMLPCATPEEAMAAARKGDTVYLGRDAELSQTLAAGVGLDGRGHTLRAAEGFRGAAVLAVTGDALNPPEWGLQGVTIDTNGAAASGIAVTNAHAVLRDVAIISKNGYGLVLTNAVLRQSGALVLGGGAGGILLCEPPDEMGGGAWVAGNGRMECDSERVVAVENGGQAESLAVLEQRDRRFSGLPWGLAGWVDYSGGRHTVVLGAAKALEQSRLARVRGNFFARLSDAAAYAEAGETIDAAGGDYREEWLVLDKPVAFVGGGAGFAGNIRAGAGAVVSGFDLSGAAVMAEQGADLRRNYWGEAPDFTQKITGDALWYPYFADAEMKTLVEAPPLLDRLEEKNDSGLTSAESEMGRVLTGALPQTTLAVLRGKMKTDGFAFFAADGSPKTDESALLVTGDILRLSDPATGAVLDELTAVVRGDCDSDGRATERDFNAVCGEVLRTAPLKGYARLAGLAAGKSAEKAGIADLLALKWFLLTGSFAQLGQ